MWETEPTQQSKHSKRSGVECFITVVLHDYANENMGEVRLDDRMLDQNL